MNSNLAHLVNYRQQLTQELTKVRRTSLHASHRGDFRTIAKLTLEAARLNRAICDTQIKEELAH